MAHTILFLASAPTDRARLRVDVEAREIMQGLQRGRQGRQFDFVTRHAVRPRDVREALLQHRPAVVHFAGHGEGSTGICLEDEAGRAKIVSAEALRSVFALVADHVACVVLNACYADAQAKAISSEISTVIGMSGRVSDRAAVVFATGFYDAVAAGEDYHRAFEWGKAALQLEGTPEEDCRPVLYARPGTPVLDPPEETARDVGVPHSGPTDNASPVEPQLAQMRSTLCNIFPSVSEIRIITLDAGLSWPRIQTNQSAEGIWQDLLELAFHGGKLGTLANITLARYPGNRTLRELLDIARQVEDTRETQPSKHASRATDGKITEGPGLATHPGKAPTAPPPPNFTVNSLEDAVLCMHPDSVNVWRDVVPGARETSLNMVEVSTPTGPWHRSAPIQWATLRAVADEIDVKTRQLRTRPIKRLHVLARGPYALGALLGSRLEGFGRQLIIYQDGNRPGQVDGKNWRSWGPTWRFRSEARTAPFFADVPELNLSPVLLEGNVLVVLDVTGHGRSALEGKLEELHLSPPLATIHLRARDAGRNAIQTDGDIDRAAGELDEAFRKISETFPKATAHLFCYAPLALLIRGSCRLHLRSIPFIVYERILDEDSGGFFFTPMVRFPERKLLLET